MKKVELLAPAGNFECLVAAINAGADAVYLGGKNFSARAFANNFDDDELYEAINYAHLRNVKIYITLNTLLNEAEFDAAIKYLDFYHKLKVDAILMQDLGLFYYAKKHYPDLPIHCSTQMHIHNLSGVKVAKELGFSRVVLARESSLNLIKEASKLGIEIETFVHGAICVSYSGQCLLSSSTLNRSANKGMCAQCCRHSYKLIEDNNHEITTNTDYLISPKDMMLINDLPKLIQAGVSCFKIEGRMKSKAYVAYVTSVYRKAIDAYYDKRDFILDEDTLKNIKVLFNRNFTNDYLYNKEDLFNQKTPNHLGIKIGKTVSYSNGYTYIKLSSDLNQFDGIRINDFGTIVNLMYKDKLLVSNAKANDIISIHTNIKLDGDVYKTLDYELENQANKIKDKKLPLNIKASFQTNKKPIININCLNDNFTFEASIICQKALKSPITKENIHKQFAKLNNTLYYLNNFEANLSDDVFISLKDLNEIRRAFIEYINNKRLENYHTECSHIMYQLSELKDDNNDTKLIQDGDYLYVDDDKYYLNKTINNDSKYSNNDYVAISEFGGLLNNNKHKLAYYTLNCYNSYCYEFLKRLNFEKIILSSEIALQEINLLIDAYKKRNNLKIIPYQFTKGKRILMYIKAHPFNEYLKRGHKYYLKDFNHKFEIVIDNDITELVEDNYDKKQHIFCLPFEIK